MAEKKKKTTRNMRLAWRQAKFKAMMTVMLTAMAPIQLTPSLVLLNPLAPNPLLTTITPTTTLMTTVMATVRHVAT